MLYICFTFIYNFQDYFYGKIRIKFKINEMI